MHKKKLTNTQSKKNLFIFCIQFVFSYIVNIAHLGFKPLGLFKSAYNKARSTDQRRCFQLIITINWQLQLRTSNGTGKNEGSRKPSTSPKKLFCCTRMCRCWSKSGLLPLRSSLHHLGLHRKHFRWF